MVGGGGVYVGGGGVDIGEEWEGVLRGVVGFVWNEG